MSENKNKIEELRKQIIIAEESLEAAKRALLELTKDDSGIYSNIDINQTKASENGNVIEGFFNGENMVGPGGKIYPVPANYASKSKLVEGDGLKLTIGDDGSFLFKQIAPIKRKSLQGTLKFEDNAYHVLADGHSYKILYASVTYHKGKPGDRVSVVLPEDGQAHWAVLESVLHEIETTRNDTEDKIVEKNTAQTPELPIPEKPQSIPDQEQLAYQGPALRVDSEVIDIKQAEISGLSTTEPLLEPMISEVNIPASEINEPQEKVVASDDLKSKLGIDDIDINSPAKTETPKEINPAAIPRVTNSSRTAINPTPPPKDLSSQSISEMDI
jgi:hypothetical protein